MDYIQEQLLRQRKALAALMNGGTGEAAEAEPAAEQTAVRSAAAAEEASVQRTASPRTHAAARSHVRQETNAGETAGAVRAATAMDRPVTAERGEIMFVGGGGQTAATDAEAVSRAIQRDARRYDGGFSLY